MKKPATPACALAAADYTARVRILIGGIIWATVALAQVDDPTAAAPPTASVSNCLAHLDNVLAELEALAEDATPQSPAAICLADKLNKARSLRELAQSLNESVETHEADEDEDSAAADRALVLVACGRIDKLAAEAKDCAKASNAKKKRRTELRPPTAAASQPIVMNRPGAAPAAIRDATTCIKQAMFAELLVEVLGLPTGSNAETPVRLLGGRAIEPLKGWRADECLTVDDLCVVVARALQLKVADANIPYSYVEAVRQAGLPVDSVLPRRRRESLPAVVLESEARLFLARGYAARLPSSRRLQPD